METALICIPTFRRPHMLDCCLRGMERIAVPDGLEVSIVVADNDAEESAREVCERHARTSRFPLTYCVEPKRGLSHVRNRLLEEALSSKADWVVCMDDDEFPVPGWLRCLYQVARERGADVVTGVVLDFLVQDMPEEGLPPPDSDIWGRGDAQPAEMMSKGSCQCGNVLFSRRLVDELGLRFDLRFNVSGWEDHYFFDQARKHGCVIWVCPAAVAYTIVPLERQGLRYQVCRGYADGRTVVFRHRIRKRWFEGARILFFVWKSGIKYLQAFGLLCLSGVVNRKQNLYRSLFGFGWGTGYLRGLCDRAAPNHYGKDMTGF